MAPCTVRSVTNWPLISVHPQNPPLFSTCLYHDLAGLEARKEHLGHFVRVVNHEIIVRSPIV